MAWLPGFGKDGFVKGQDLCRPDDFNVRMLANIAFDGNEPVPGASGAEMEIFLSAKSISPKSVFYSVRW